MTRTERVHKMDLIQRRIERGKLQKNSGKEKMLIGPYWSMSFWIGLSVFYIF